MTASGTVETSEAQQQPERLQETIQRGLGRVVPRVDRPQDVRIRHLGLLGELLDAHRQNHVPEVPEGDLDRHPFVHGHEEEIARELRVAKVLRKAFVPVSAASCDYRAYVP